MNAIAMGSPRCAHFPIEGEDPLGWTQARDRCRSQGYTGVHVYISTYSDFLHSTAAMMAAADPYRQDTMGRERIRVIHATQPLELKRALAQMLMRCEVIDFAVINGHALPGSQGFQNGETMEIGQFLIDALGPCALSPHARLQFSGCNLACRNVSTQVREQITIVLSAPNIIPPENPRPFGDVRFLFNTATGYTLSGPYSHQLDWYERNIQNNRRFIVRSENDIGLEYYFRQDGQLVTDLPFDQIPQCTR